MNNFKRQSLSEQMKDQDKQFKKAQRDNEREKRNLERQEKQLELDIKKAAREGNKQICARLARHLIQLREQKARICSANSKIQSVGLQTKTMASGVKLANTIASTTKSMDAVNKQLNPHEIAKTLQNFEKEISKIDMSEELIEDTLNAVLDESGDEEEQDAVINRVLDEIGIEISGKMAMTPSAHFGSLGAKSQKLTDEDIEKQLSQLRA